MAETFADNELRSSIRGKINANASEQNGTAIAMANLVARLETSENKITALEGGTVPPPTTGDGTLTTEVFARYDAHAYGFQATGSSGQAFERASSVTAFEGTGYAGLNNVSGVAGTSAIAYMNVTANNTADRKVYMRVYGPVGAIVAGCSHGGGTLGTATIPAAQIWEWVEVTTVHKQYDAQYQLHGRSAGVAVDAIIITTTTNMQIPTGRNGYRNS